MNHKKVCSVLEIRKATAFDSAWDMGLTGKAVASMGS
jgi:hypothetical protein